MLRLTAISLLLVSSTYGCKFNEDCEVGSECEKGVCQKSDFISIPGNCPDPNEEWRECGEECVPTCKDPHPVCVQNCAKHSCQCKPGYVREKTKCQLYSSCKDVRSMTTPSTRSHDRFEALRPDECRTNSDCPSGFMCGLGFCAPLTTKAPSRRHKSGFSESCSTDRDCLSIYVCDHGKCAREGQKTKVSMNIGNRCEVDRDCSIGLKCSSVHRCSSSSMAGDISPSLGSVHNQEHGSSGKTSSSGGSSRGVPLSEFFSGDTLKYKDGTILEQSSIDNSYVILFFCAEWSFPCKDILPVLNKFYKAVFSSGDKLEVIYISKDNSEDEYRKFTSALEDVVILPFNYSRTADLMKAFDVHGVPTMPLIKNGEILVKDVRADLHFAQRQDPIMLFDKWQHL